MVDSVDVERLDAAIEAAIAAGSPAGLTVLGFGEVTLVVGWPTDAPRVAVKRLPRFPTAQRAAAYAALLEEWLAALRARGVPVLETTVQTVAAASGGGTRAYLVQPLARPEALLHHVLRDAPPERGEQLLARLVELVTQAVDRGVGLDAQWANWVVEDGDLRLLDISTPMLRDAGGRDRLDLGVFFSVYPWAIRPLLRPVARAVMEPYHQPRGVLLDAASNLIKEELEPWLPALLRIAADRLDRPIELAEVHRYFTRDRRTWMLMQRLRRADRAWQRGVRRRPYPFLLPPPYQYGPPRPRGDASWTTPKASS